MKMESDASGKDQADVWSEGSYSKPVDVEAGCGESEDEHEELYILFVASDFEWFTASRSVAVES